MSIEEEKIDNLSDQVLIKSVVALVTGKGRNFQSIGTGTLIEHNNQLLVVSASHVFQESKSLAFYIGGNNLCRLHGEIIFLGRTKEEIDDINIGFAVLRISPDKLPHHIAIPSSILRSNEEESSCDNLLITGFPSSRSKVNRYKGSFISEPQGFRALKGKEDKNHIYFPHEKNNYYRQGKRVQTCDLPGLSGSPVWSISESHKTKNTQWLPLEGIVIEESKQHKHIKITKNYLLYRCIQNFFATQKLNSNSSEKKHKDQSAEFFS